jgi:hypothetical protein
MAETSRFRVKVVRLKRFDGMRVRVRAAVCSLSAVIGSATTVSKSVVRSARPT